LDPDQDFSLIDYLKNQDFKFKKNSRQLTAIYEVEIIDYYVCPLFDQ